MHTDIRKDNSRRSWGLIFLVLTSMVGLCGFGCFVLYDYPGPWVA